MSQIHLCVYHFHAMYCIRRAISFFKIRFFKHERGRRGKPQNAFDGNGEDIFIPKPQRGLPKNRSFIHWLSFLFSLFGCIWHKTCCVFLSNGKEKRSRGDVEGIGGAG